MPNTRSAAKQMRQNIKRRERNRAVKSATRTFMKRALAAIEAGQLDQAPEAVRVAQHALDKAAEKGVIHKNNAARHKSQLMLRLNAALAAASGPAAAEEKPARRRTAAQGRTAAARGRTTAKAKAEAEVDAKPARSTGTRSRRKQES